MGRGERRRMLSASRGDERVTERVSKTGAIGELKTVAGEAIKRYGSERPCEVHVGQTRPLISKRTDQRYPDGSHPCHAVQHGDVDVFVSLGGKTHMTALESVPT